MDAEFGFSALIQKDGRQYGFDTGKAGHFLSNARKLNVDLGQTTDVLLSHAHYDHCGGLLKYLDAFKNKKHTLWVKDCFFEGAQDKYYDDIVGAKLDFTDGDLFVEIIDHIMSVLGFSSILGSSGTRVKDP